MKEPVRPLYGLRVAVLGVALVSGGGALLLWMLASVIGPFDFGTMMNAEFAVPHVAVQAGSGGENVEARVERLGPRRLLVRVTNSGEEAVEDAVLEVDLAGSGSLGAVRGTRLLATAPIWRLRDGGEIVEISVPVLERSESAAWFLDLEGREGG